MEALPDSGMLLAVLEHTPALVFVSEFVSGRIMYVNPAGVGLLGLGDAVHAYARTTAELFTDVGLVQAREVESALVERGEWNGLTEFRHFVTGEPIPMLISTFVLQHTRTGPSLIASIAQDRRGAEEDEQRLHRALAESAYRAREQQAIADLSQLAVGGDLDELLAAAAGAAAALMGVQCSSIAQMSDDGELAVLAYRGPEPSPTTFAPGRGSQPGYATASGAVIVCADRVHETRFSTVGMTRRGLHSGVCVPIGAEAAWGVLTAHSRRPREYTDRDLTFLRSVTAVLSAAIRRIEAEAALVYQSLHDPLTGLPNRALARRRLDDALDAAPRGGTRVALLLVDLDDFKIVNDSLGHAGGDDALVVLARHLRSAVRPGDTVARLGGDEFVVVCEHVAGAAEAVAIAARITGSVADLNRAGSLDWPISASIGVALSDPECTREELVRRADSAMYRAKAAGAGSYAFYGGPF
ncbi:sensor domain-containing diguanylate cyclase [Rhodococcus opacus]|uniref:Sensor domain-containing diguanylate cyclase n=1 Tax=Rhodococcus opacus TaxID=37919 RepID=A0AAX3Y4Y3_RHOOP|nr:sensor domain-containing diguanylate cyclase [Rhodococcus opacus]MCZ4587016.1 sensor domain-containing diguanylate cyclase [Rhodococcus opacus]WLF44188.1 sensor domain-containing diguanylate cyclase [Rhodococcus opacus]